MFDANKYRPQIKFDYPGRTWPGRELTSSPVWCSVDLRDGNQALELPMTLDQKLDYFQLLVDIGFKEIELGYPAANKTEVAFCRYLIKHNLIPDDVTIQVMTAAKEGAIQQTFEAVRGARRVIINYMLPISPVQRDYVLRQDQSELIDLAMSGARLVRELAEERPRRTEFIFEFTPESFNLAEMDFAVQISDAVMNVWEPTPGHKAIINLPATVELSSPNVYADQVEFFADHINGRENIILSCHTHNDRGSAVAVAELALLAGCDRVEGTILGNGERSGNCDLITLALNLFSQGIDPGLNLKNLPQITESIERLTGLGTPPRQPYAGSLVFTAFSGSHQDAIRKSLAQYEQGDVWDVPYLPIDPRDIGREYESIIRINAQSGKGGLDWILSQRFGMNLPLPFLRDLSQAVTVRADQEHETVSAETVLELFTERYLNLQEPLRLDRYAEHMISSDEVSFEVSFTYRGEPHHFTSTGTGVIDAFGKILSDFFSIPIEVSLYHQHAVDRGSSSKALTYIQIISDGKYYLGCGTSGSIAKSSLRALVSAVNNLLLPPA